MIAKDNNTKQGGDNEEISKEDLQKIESLKGVIEEAEKSLYSARAMLQRLESKSKPGGSGPIKKTYGASPDGKVVEGVFDGQIMIGNDGKQYPVPANYASKSKLVEGDMLKLTITDDGNFVYKQIGPVDRKRLIGFVKEDSSGNYIIEVEGKIYKVLLASVTYYKAQPGDEVTVIIPKNGEPTWCSIENVTKKGVASPLMNEESDPFMKEETESIDLKKEEKNNPGEDDKKMERDTAEIVDEWTPNLKKLEEEAAEIEESAKLMTEEEKKSEGEKESKGGVNVQAGENNSDGENDDGAKVVI
jgi:hypothetical protein